MDQVQSNFYENQILEAIETVASGLVSEIKFDRTVICTITNDSKKKDGIYEVNDGSSTFIATSSDTTYSKDTVVHVLIPEGDYERQKTIVGKYVDNGASAINYISAMDSFIPIKTYTNESEYCLLTNHPTQRYLNIPLNNINDLADNPSFYNCVGIQAKFKTNLSEYNILEGNYGLVLTLYGEDNTTKEQISPRSYGINCSNMYGDPYNYNFYFTQSMIFDLPSEFNNIKITNATLAFYQNDDFITIDNEKLEYRIEGFAGNYSMLKNPNLYVKDIELVFGYSLVGITSECIKLYSLNDQKYTSREDEKNLLLKWFIQNDVSQSVPYSVIDSVLEADEDYGLNDYSIYWYRQEINNQDKDPLAGVYWNIIPEGVYQDCKFIHKIGTKKIENASGGEEEVDFELPDLEYTLEINENGKYSLSPDNKLILATESSGDRYNVLIDKSAKRYDGITNTMLNPFEYTFAPNNLLSDEQIKVILVRNEYIEVQTPGKGTDMNTYIHFEDASQYFESNKIIYTNANPGDQNLNAVDLIRNMTLNCQDKSNGIYKIYDGVDNKVINNENTRKRRLDVIFDTYSSQDISADSENCSIKWKIPRINSMIHPVNFTIIEPEILKKPETSDIIIDTKERLVEWQLPSETSPYYECSYNWRSNIAGTDDYHEGANLFAYYSVGEYYSQAYNNNTIICEITKYGKKYVQEIEFVFGEVGTSGTGYTLNLRLDKEYDYPDKGNETTVSVPCLTADENKMVKVIATLFDETGKDITEDKKVLWNWKLGESFVVGFEIVNGESGSNYCYVRYTEEKKGSEENLNDFLKRCYGIIQASVNITWNGKTTSLISYLPLNLRTNRNKVAAYSGTTKIIYNQQGSSPIFQKEHLLFNDEGAITPEINSWTVAVKESGWNNYAPYFIPPEKINDPITEDWSGNSDDSVTGAQKPWILAARDMYFTDLQNVPIIIQAFDEKGDLLYSQSLLYCQNRYGISMFNDWDGSLVIDEEGNKILSAFIGAGKKEDNNTFSGVVMGDFKSIKDGTDIRTGLLGFKEGVETFGFNTDGKAFMGASGQGQILFDGTKGTITSGNYSVDKSGMKIDLDDGAVEINPTEIIITKNDFENNYDGDEEKLINSLQSAYITLNSNKNPYFEIKSISSIKDSDKDILEFNYNPLIYIGNNNYYLQSKNYNTPYFMKVDPETPGEEEKKIYIPGRGVKIDLANGKLYGYNFEIQAGQQDNEIIITSDSSKDPLTIGKNFKVEWDGTLTASKGHFTGSIEALSGKIGGWTFVKNALFKWGDFDETTHCGTNGDLTKFQISNNTALIAPNGVNDISNQSIFTKSVYTQGEIDAETGDYTVLGYWEDKESDTQPNKEKIVLSIGNNLIVTDDGTVYANNAILNGYAPREQVPELSKELIDFATGKVDLEATKRLQGDNDEAAARQENDNKLNGKIGSVNFNSKGLISLVGTYEDNMVFMDSPIGTDLHLGYYDEKDGVFYKQAYFYSDDYKITGDKYKNYYDLETENYYKYDDKTTSFILLDSSSLTDDEKQELCAIDGYYVDNNFYSERSVGKGVNTYTPNTGHVYVDLNDDDYTAYIYDGGYRLTKPEDNIVLFMVNKKGLLRASNAVIEGEIYAHKGYIGGWVLQHPLESAGKFSGGLTYNNIDTEYNGSGEDTPWIIGINAANFTPGNGLYIANNILFGGTDSNPNVKPCVLNIGQKFAITTDGTIYANGSINATAGKIGGWTIVEDALLYGYSSLEEVTTEGDNTNKAFIVPGEGVEVNENSWTIAISDNFGVTKDGMLYSTSANIEGKIYSTEGNIGGWEIKSGYLIHEAKVSSETSPFKIKIGNIIDSTKKFQIFSKESIKEHNTNQLIVGSDIDCILTQTYGIMYVLKNTSFSSYQFSMDEGYEFQYAEAQVVDENLNIVGILDISNWTITETKNSSNGNRVIYYKNAYHPKHEEFFNLSVEKKLEEMIVGIEETLSYKSVMMKVYYKKGEKDKIITYYFLSDGKVYDTITSKTYKMEDFLSNYNYDGMNKSVALSGMIANFSTTATKGIELYDSTGEKSLHFLGNEQSIAWVVNKTTKYKLAIPINYNDEHSLVFFIGDKKNFLIDKNGNFVFNDFKSNNDKYSIGGFKLNGEISSSLFWNNSLFTNNTYCHIDANNNITKATHYVGFMRAVGNESKSLSNVFLGCKQISQKVTSNDELPTTFPTGKEWSENSIYNFSIKFNGDIYTKTTLTVDKSIISYGQILARSHDIQPNNYNGSIIISGKSNLLAMDSNTIAVPKISSSAGESEYVNLYIAAQGILPGFPKESDGSHRISGTSLGTTEQPWYYVNGITAAVETVSNTSDARLKDIQYNITQNQLLSIYNNLNPVAYKYKNLSSNENHSRTHFGFLAQEVEKIIENVGLTNEDFAAVQIVNLDESMPGCEDGKKYYLNYNEFHGLHVLKNKEQDSRIKDLENRVQELEQQILELRGKGV